MKHIVFVSIVATLALVVSSCSEKEEPQSEPKEATTITIDGDFTDWNTLIKNGKAVSSALDQNKKYDKQSMQQLAVYVDVSDIYFMVGFDMNKTQPLDIFFATKGEVPTDAINLWNPCYVDYLLEFGKGDSFVGDGEVMDWSNWKYQQLMTYNHQLGGWNWTNLSQNMVTLSDKIEQGGTTMVEGKIARSNFEFTKNYFYVAAFISDGNWIVTGTQPAAEIINDEVSIPEMMKVNLPE